MSKLQNTFVFLLICFLATPGNARGGARPTPATNSDWRSRLTQELPLLGHRNWIAVVDSAYPLQTSAGIETIPNWGLRGLSTLTSFCTCHWFHPRVPTNEVFSQHTIQ